MKYLVDIADQDDPAINLAAEEYILRNYDIQHDYVLVYLNAPAVVIGRHQNIYEEINLPFVLRNTIPVYRRISGGGTVYHDQGNLNFSFITRYEKFKFNNYLHFNEPIIDFLNQRGVPAYHSDRNDMLIDDKKFSGNAQFTSRDRMVSHGTLLYSSDLSRLSESLKPMDKKIHSRAIKSVRSPVINVRNYLKPELSIEEFREKLIRHLFAGQGHVPGIRLTDEHLEKINQLAEKKYRQWEWTFAESPDCTIESSCGEGNSAVHCKTTVSKGRIKKIVCGGPGITDTEKKHLAGLLTGQRFYPGDINEILTYSGQLASERTDLLKRLFF